MECFKILYKIPQIGLGLETQQTTAHLTRNFLLKNYRKLISNGKNLELLILFTVQKTGKL